MNKFFFIAFIYFFPLLGRGQEQFCRQVLYKNEFHKLTVNAITSDSNHLLWLGTNQGILTFDGHEYRTINISDSIKNANVTKIQFYKNHIGIASSQGFLLYNYKNKTSQFFNENSKPALTNSLVFDFIRHKNGDTWIAGWEGLHLLSNNKIEHYKPDQSPIYRENVITRLFETDSGLWVGAESGMYFFSFLSLQFKSIPVCSSNNAYVRSFMKDNNGNLWTATYNYGICIYDTYHQCFVKASDYFENKNIPDVKAISLCEDSQNVWVGVEGGMLKIPKTETKTAKVDFVFIDAAIYSLYVHKGNIWMGSWNKSIWQYNSFFNRIKSIFDINQHFKIPTNNKIFSILTYNNETHFVFNSGLVIITDTNWIEKRRITLNIKKGSAITFYKYNEAFTCFVANSLLSIVDNKSLKILVLNYKSDETGDLTHSEISDIKDDLKGNIWISTRKGIVRYQKSDQSIHKYFFSENPRSISHNQIESIFIMGNGSIAFLAINGINIYHPESDDFSRMLNPELNRANSILSYNGYWISTDNGVLQYDEKLNFVAIYNSSHGLLQNRVLSLRKDNRGRICCINEHFISIFDTTLKRFINFPFKEYGIQSTMSEKILMTSVDDHLFFTNNTNLYSLDTRIEQKGLSKTKIIFTSILINGEDKTLDYYFTLNEGNPVINLNYQQNTIKIDFALSNYLNQENTSLSYKVEGINNSWYDTGNDRKINCSNLLPGTYKITVNAIDYLGDQSLYTSEILIHIQPPFWQRWWFYLIEVLLLVGIVFIVFRIRLAAMKRYQKILETQVRERTRTIEQQNEEILNINDALKKQSDTLANTNEKLVLSNATKDKFFTIIAHDLKNPFSAILGLSELLYAGLRPKNDSHTEMAKNIFDSSKHTFNLLQNLLEWARAQTGGITFKPASTNIRSIVFETCTLLTPLAAKKNIQLINHVPVLLTAHCDGNMITTVIRNIMNNAVKFTPESGSITIKGSLKDSNTIEIAVSDNGVGMDEQTKNKLFRIDVHHTTSGTSGESGTGLGLIVCKEFVDKNGGLIWVESEPGKGSSFIFTLPKAATDIVFNDPQSNNDTNNYNSPLETNALIQTAPDDAPLVLIVDDNAELRRKIRAAISSAYKTIEASDGLNGFNAATEIIPDLIISDVVMPVMDGLEMCSKLKSDDRTSHIPIIMLSSKDAVEEKVEGLQTGVDDYLTKPFENIELLARVNTLIENRRILRKKFESSINTSTPFSKSKNADNSFMMKIESIIEKNIDNAEYDIDQFSSDLGMSTAQLYRKIGAITDLKPYELIKSIRLKKAAEMLQESSLNVNEVAFRVGFKDHSHFTKAFKNMFGVSPSEYQKK